MNFCSINYFVFLPITLLLYWRTRGAARVWLLVLASYVFYLSWIPIYGLLLFVLSFVNWLIALLCWRAGRLGSQIILASGIVVNIGVLLYFKYATFAVLNFDKLVSFLGMDLTASNAPQFAQANLSERILPLGISFFAFEFIHYLVDVQRGYPPIRSLSKFLAFAAFFPSQIAGPIKRFQEFEKNRDEPEPWSQALFYEGGALIVQGVFKKLALADPLGILVSPVFSPGANYCGLDAMIGIIGFAIQLYCDFSGYTDMGRGSSLLMGIRLPTNFALPYLAPDILSFWRRWHKSLSNWLRDYVYIPLGGSRCSQSRKHLNILVTMTICGLWHGAQWHFVFFGLFNGLAMIVNELWLTVIANCVELRKISNSSLGKIVGYCFCVATWLCGWVIFRAPCTMDALKIFKGLFHFSASLNLVELSLRSGVVHMLAVYLGFWLVLEFVRRNKTGAPVGEPQQSGGLIFSREVRLASWTVATFLIMGVRPVESMPFIYFQF